MVGFPPQQSIDDNEPGFVSDLWTTKSKQSGQWAPLRADRWYSTSANAASDSDSDHDCVGILCGFWHRAKIRRMLAHSLAGGDEGGGSEGYVAVYWESILQGDNREYGQYRVLSVLLDKVARHFMLNSRMILTYQLIPTTASRGLLVWYIYFPTVSLLSLTKITFSPDPFSITPSHTDSQ